MDRSEDNLTKEYRDGYLMGRADERDRISTVLELDLLIPENIKPRIKDLIRGGKELDD